MIDWVIKGLKTGVKTTRYPGSMETAPGISPGQPVSGANIEPDDARILIAQCPTGALDQQDNRIMVDNRSCIHCSRCQRGRSTSLDRSRGYEWTRRVENRPPRFSKVFQRSLYIRFVDAGACGACLTEIKQIGKPYYNIHRLGFFITPTPRKADVLLIAGPITDNMRLALRKAYEAMPEPRCVIAVGTCALTGGVFGPSFASGAGVSDLIPVDIEIPGCPPPPLAILHGLLVAVGRKSPATDPEPIQHEEATS